MVNFDMMDGKTALLAMNRRSKVSKTDIYDYQEHNWQLKLLEKSKG